MATFQFGGPSEDLGSTVTAADGTWVLPADRVRDVGPINLRQTRCEILVWKPGVGMARTEWSTWPDAGEIAWEGKSLTLLEAARPVTGRVVTEAADPVPAAHVWFCPEAGLQDAFTVTGPSGLFVLEWPAGFRGDVFAFESVHGVGRRSLTDLGADDRLPDLVLAATSFVEGQVRHADGTPLGGVSVSGESREPAAARDPCLGSSWHQGSARTAEGGQFRLLLPQEGACRLWIEGSAAEAEARTGDRRVLLVVPEHRFRLRIRDAEGRPLPATGLFAMGWAPEHADRLDDLLAGRSPFRDAHLSADWVLATSGTEEGGQDLFLPAGSLGVAQVAVPGMAPAEAVLRVPERGSQTDVDLVVGRARARGALRVTCVDARGAGIPHAKVEISTRLGARLAQGTVGPGHRWSDIAAGPVWVRAEARGGPTDLGFLPPRGSFHLPATAQAEIEAGSTVDVTLRLEDGGRLRVLLRKADPPPPVLDEEQNPVLVGGPGVRAVEVATGRSQALMLYVGEEGTPGEGHASSSSVYNRPMLSAEVLAAGEYRIEVAEPGTGWADPVASAPATVLPRRVTEVVIDLPRSR